MVSGNTTHSGSVEKVRILFLNGGFVICEEFVKNSDGKIMGCVKCNHGRQNHDNEWRESARKNTEQSQKRDTDFG